jgi:outer membrane protein assembly factor BamA
MDRMREGITALYALGLFSSVRIDYTGFETGSDTLFAVVTLAEQDYIQVDLAGGYISPEAVFGSTYWIQPNIMGNNQSIRLGGMYTRYISSGNRGNEFLPEVVYEEPWFLSTRWTAQLRLGYYYLQRDHQEERRISGEAALSRRFMDVWRYTGGYTIARLRFRSTMEDSTVVYRDWGTTARIRSSFTRDTRNPLLNPSEGSWFKLAGSLAGGVVGGSIDFYTVDGEYRLFLPVNRRLVLAGRVGGSVALGYDGNTDIPPNDRLYLGGGTTVRGYDHQTLGPVDADGNPLGGNVMALANAEARLRLIGNLGAALFCDAGGVWSELGQISRGTTGFGIGLGLRFDTPIGPLRLDYGFAPTWSNSLKRGKVYFAIGQPF